jgi:hypothetical protein
MEMNIITIEKVIPLMGLLQVYILLQTSISNSPPQVGRCSKHFQLEMRKYKERHQANESTKKDAGNTSAKRIATTLNHHPVEANQPQSHKRHNA